MLNKIKDNIFLKSTLILLIGGIFGKIVGFILKIIITRNLGTTGMGIYSLISPTSALLSTIAIFSYPTALSKIISERKYSNKDLFISIIPLSIMINLILIFIVIFISKYLSYYLIKSNELYLPIISLSLTMPFISISSILKGYYWGKQNMFPYMLSNFIEQIARLVLICIFLNKINNLIYKICFIILVNIIGEIISQIVMIFYFPKFNLNNLKIKKECNKEILNISIPTTSSKLIGTFAYFLEPIILINILLIIGFDRDYIVYEYGIINAYSLSILLMPQFFTQNMSTSLIPELSKQYSLHNYDMCKKRIKQIVYSSLFIGILSTLIILLFPTFFLNLLYKTNEGIDYIRLLSPFIPLFYIEYPLSNSLQALGKSKISFKITFISSIIKLLSLILFSFMGIYTVIISIILNLIITTILYFREIRKILR